MIEREPRWFVYRCEDVHGSSLTLTLGPTRSWVKLGMEVNLAGEAWAARLVWAGTEEPDEELKDQLAEEGEGRG